jgi:hypothetical protein
MEHKATQGHTSNTEKTVLVRIHGLLLLALFSTTFSMYKLHFRQRTHASFAGGLNSINIVMSKPAKTAACVPTVTVETETFDREKDETRRDRRI